MNDMANAPRGKQPEQEKPKARMEIEQNKITIHIKAGGQSRTVTFHDYTLEGFQVTPIQGMIDTSMMSAVAERPCMFALKLKARHHETDIRPEDITYVDTPQGNVNPN